MVVITIISQKVYKQVVDTGVDFNPSFILSPELTNQEKVQYFKNIRKSMETSIINDWDMRNILMFLGLLIQWRSYTLF